MTSRFGSARSRFLKTGLLVATLVALPSVVFGLVFNFVPAAGMSPAAIAGFQAAGNRWSGLLKDNIVVNININFTALGAGILGSTNSSSATTTYSNFKTALTADKTSALDNQAVASLPAGSSVGMLLNYTSNSPNGAGSPTPFLDNDGDTNNTTISGTTANFKALGLIPAAAVAVDASISFSNLFTWDFDPTDGITPGAFDFVGIAAHEIGHALGFESGVDILDGNSSGTFFPDNLFTFLSPLDLFRYSAASTAQGVIDWTANTTPKYFSVDGGLTNLGNFSTGVTHGDGSQASHWKDNLGLGIMDPTAAPGELLNISALDLKAFDAIGFDLDIPPVPEPSTYGLMGAGVLGSLIVLRRRRR